MNAPWRVATAYVIENLRDLLDAVVRGFFGDDDVVDVAFAEAGERYTQETGVVLQFSDRAATAVAHASAQASYELITHFGKRSLVWHPAFDAFWNQFAVGGL